MGAFIMKVLIHDLKKEELLNLFPSISSEIKIISQDSEIKKCIGCFNCWVKTPGSCIIKDGYGDNGKLFAEREELIIISKICYGGYSLFVKNVLDRSIGYILPFFTIRNNEMHHKSRYKERFKLSVIAYGNDATQKEKDILSKLVIANGLNFNAIDPTLYITDNISNISKVRGIL